MQPETLTARHAHITLPLLGRPVGARLEKTVEDSEVGSLFHSKLELPMMEELLNYLLYAGLLPQASENQVRAYLTDCPCWKTSMSLTCRLKRDSERSRASVAPDAISWSTLPRVHSTR
jgi:hypothetical protein